MVIQTLTPIVLFSLKTLGSHLMLILMHTGSLFKSFLMLMGIMKKARAPLSSQMIDNPVKEAEV